MRNNIHNYIAKTAIDYANIQPEEIMDICLRQEGNLVEVDFNTEWMNYICYVDLSGEALQQAVAQKIREKDAKVSLVGNMVSEGTTPRHLTDLIGSLCDLTSGSGDKGTPIVYIQGYFDNYTND